MNILAIESSSDICSAALFVGNKLIDIMEADIPRSHSKLLPEYLNKLIHNSGEEINAIALSIGPGSFTGLRIGTSLAKGIANARGIAIIPVPTIKTIKYQFQNNGKHCICLYSYGSYLFKQDYEDSTEVGNPEFVKFDQLDSDSVYYGSGLSNFDWSGKNYIDKKLSARWVGELAIKNFDFWCISDLNLIKPNYITNFNFNKR
jgi:tRNA threonylcarbamoyladenosine biosynthesis protein TsaB